MNIANTNIHCKDCFQTSRDFFVVGPGNIVQYLICAIENGIPFCKLNIQLDFILKVRDENPNVCKCEIILFKKIVSVHPQLSVVTTLLTT